MRIFATEFPVYRKNNAEFIAHVIQWLRGTAYSRVLESVDQEIQPDDFLATSTAGEQLRMREVNGENLSAIGFRHDYPDKEGRNWRTEAVLLWSENNEQAKLRLRTQCQARVPGAPLDFPRKPYLIKSLLDDGWGSMDGNLTVSGTPKWLERDPVNIELAAQLMAGEGTIDLPILYVSATGLNSWLLSKDDIERLAYRLGGVAHVVVEPDRAFSFDLKDMVDGRNAYGGSIGLYAPKLGYVSRFFRGWELSTNNLLMERIQSFTTGLRTRMPSSGWEWAELQEASLKAKRTTASEQTEFKELEKIYLEEIGGHLETIKEQRETIADLNKAISSFENAQSKSLDSPITMLTNLIGDELYQGELSDRLRYAAKIALLNTNTNPLDKRTVEFLKIFDNKVGGSPDGPAFVDQLKDCTSSNDKILPSLIPFLEARGFKKTSEKRNIKMEPSNKLLGLDPIILPKTPSDHRAAKNLRSQLMKELGLRNLGL